MPEVMDSARNNTFATSKDAIDAPVIPETDQHSLSFRAIPDTSHGEDVIELAELEHLGTPVADDDVVELELETEGMNGNGVAEHGARLGDNVRHQSDPHSSATRGTAPSTPKATHQLATDVADNPNDTAIPTSASNFESSAVTTTTTPTTNPHHAFPISPEGIIPELPTPAPNPHPRVQHNLSRDDIRTDKILRQFARVQGISLETPIQQRPAPGDGIKAFTARPAPKVPAGGVGVALSKGDAIKLGLWKPKERVKKLDEALGVGRTEKDLVKPRASVAIASLAAPVNPPRQNRSAQLRAGDTTTPRPPTSALKSREEVLADKKLKAEEERLKRRQSMALPASLSAPAIAPRMNKTAALRSGTTGPSTSGPPSSLLKRQSALMSTTANNVQNGKPGAGLSEKDKDAEKSGTTLARRATVGPVRSLSRPSIAPRLNKAAMLRTNPSTTDPTNVGAKMGAGSKTTTTSSSIPRTTATPTATISTAARRASMQIGSASRLAPATSNGATGTNPPKPPSSSRPTTLSTSRSFEVKPTKASLLRAG